jgi:hypothetical protein
MAIFYVVVSITLVTHAAAKCRPDRMALKDHSNRSLVLNAHVSECICSGVGNSSNKSSPQVVAVTSGFRRDGRGVNTYSVYVVPRGFNLLIVYLVSIHLNQISELPLLIYAFHVVAILSPIVEATGPF